MNTELLTRRRTDEELDVLRDALLRHNLRDVLDVDRLLDLLNGNRLTHDEKDKVCDALSTLVHFLIDND